MLGTEIAMEPLLRRGLKRSHLLCWRLTFSLTSLWTNASARNNLRNRLWLVRGVTIMVFRELSKNLQLTCNGQLLWFADFLEFCNFWKILQFWTRCWQVLQEKVNFGWMFTKFERKKAKHRNILRESIKTNYFCFYQEILYLQTFFLHAF